MKAGGDVSQCNQFYVYAAVCARQAGTADILFDSNFPLLLSPMC
jgi:hypothetical protein